MTVAEFLRRLVWTARTLGGDRVREIARLCGVRGSLHCIPPAVLKCLMETLEDRARTQLGSNTAEPKR